jgi:Lrp/AsnC family transcriptional regulator for asnA, asnC and gidA
MIARDVASPARISAVTAPHRARAVDALDRQLIECLQQDGRTPFTKLAADVGLSEAAVRQRVQRLLDTGALQIVGVTNPVALGLGRMAMIGVRVDGDTAPVAGALEQLDAVEYLVVTAGSFDLFCEVVVADDHALLDAVREIRRVPGVRSTETFIYLDLVKQTYAWGAH